MGTAPTTGQSAEELRLWLESPPEDAHTDARWLLVAEWEVFLTGKHSLANPAAPNEHAKPAHKALCKVVGSRNEKIRTRARERLAYLSEIGR